MTQFQNNSIFWVEVDKIKPNPYQPRKEFDEVKLKDLADSLRMYGVLQPLTVTRKEFVKSDGGIGVEYELIAGERRHRAAKIAGLSQVPVIIRSGPEDAKIKLELAIIENLQREDLNSIDRAKAFAQLADEFGFTHTEIARKMGKSREYVSNSMRLLTLPEEMQQAIVVGKISEGHARPLLMLKDRPEEQMVLFKEVMFKKVTVREAEKIARNIAQDRIKSTTKPADPKLLQYEKKLSESFGTRVQIESKQVGGKLIIDFFSDDDLQGILDLVNASILRTNKSLDDSLNRYIEQKQKKTSENEVVYNDSQVALLANEQQHLKDGRVDGELLETIAHTKNLAPIHQSINPGMFAFTPFIPHIVPEIPAAIVEGDSHNDLKFKVQLEDKNVIDDGEEKEKSFFPKNKDLNSVNEDENPDMYAITNFSL